MNHTELAQAFARLVVDRRVYVYDNGQLVEGSPFKTQPAALTAIGINTRSSAIKRNIDTNKKYLNRYTFYSKPNI